MNPAWKVDDRVLTWRGHMSQPHTHAATITSKHVAGEQVTWDVRFDDAEGPDFGDDYRFDNEMTLAPQPDGAA